MNYIRLSLPWKTTSDCHFEEFTELRQARISSPYLEMTSVIHLDCAKFCIFTGALKIFGDVSNAQLSDLILSDNY